VTFSTVEDALKALVGWVIVTAIGSEMQPLEFFTRILYVPAAKPENT
jgi:hypothetical protein